MKRSVFDYFSIRLRILGINIANTFNIETAYPAENWANILSTLFYVGSYIIFLNVLFGNVKSLAGYSKNDMLFFTFVGQLAFYTAYTWSYENMEQLIESVHRGEMDLLLTKPLPTLFYVCTRKFTVIKLIRDAFLPMLMIGLLINWSDLHLTPIRIVAGFIIFICGQFSVHVIQFMLSVPAFWYGQSGALLRMSYILSNSDFPLEGLTRYWRALFITLVPIFIPVALSTSVMLGKSPVIKSTIWALTISLFAFFVKAIFWKKALAVYNSASS